MENNPNTPVTEILTHINRLKLQRRSQQKTGRGTGIVLSYLYDNDTNVIPSELGKMMNVSTPRITTILNKLEAKNLIERKISPEDRRNVFITLSNEGRKMAAEKKAQQEKLIQTLVSRVDEQDIQAFIRVLDALEIVIDEQVGNFNKERDWLRRINTRELDREITAQPPKVTRQLLNRIYLYLKPYRLQVGLSILVILFASLLGVLPSMLTGRIIDEGFIGGNFTKLVTLIAASFLVLILTGLVGLLQSYLGSWLSQNIGKDMRNHMYGHLQKLSQGFYSSGKQGEIITRMTSDISGVQSFVTGTLTQTIANLATLTTSMIAMFQMNGALAIVAILIVPLLIFPIKLVGKKRWELTNESQDLNDEAN